MRGSRPTARRPRPDGRLFVSTRIKAGASAPVFFDGAKAFPDLLREVDRKCCVAATAIVFLFMTRLIGSESPKKAAVAFVFLLLRRAPASESFRYSRPCRVRVDHS